MDKLERMQNDTRQIYKGEGVYEVNTKNLSVLDVTKRVAEIIYRHEYQTFQLHKTLLELEKSV